MAKNHVVLLAFVILVLVIVSAPATAEKRPVQLSLVTPIQIFPEDDAIAGFRFNLLYGRNASITGVDLGLVNHTTTGLSKAWQIGLVGLADSDFVGWQYNTVNVVQAKFKGFQWGMVNYAESAEGFQLGFVNYVENMHGLQIGLVNIIRQNGMLPVFPFFNFSF